MGPLTTLFGTRGTITRTQVWLTTFGVQIAAALVPGTPVIHTEQVKLRVWIGFIEGQRFHLTAPASAADWISLAACCTGSVLVLWVLAAALIRRLNAHGRSPYWLLTLVGFVAFIQIEIAANPGPHFSLMGLLFAVLLVPFVFIMLWGMVDVYFRRGPYEGGPADAAGDLRKISGTPAR